MTDRIATTIGRRQEYQIIEAQNAFSVSGSEFFKGYHLEEQRTVGVHFIQSPLPADLHFREHFVPKMNVARRLQDPNLIRVRDFALEEQDGYVVTEWLEGKPLVQLQEELRTKNQAFGLVEAIELVQQIGCAIETLDLNDSHLREINPRTITLLQSDQGKTAPFEAVLTDLGLITLANGVGVALQGRSNVELRYMAPELLEGKAPSLTSAVYALGVLLYELLLDAPPFAIETIKDAQDEYKNKKVLSLRAKDPDFPAPLEAVLLTALEKDDKKRYERPRTLIGALARVLATFGVLTWQLEHRQVVKIGPLLPSRKAQRQARPAEAYRSHSIQVEKRRLKAVVTGENTTITVFNRTNQVDHLTIDLLPGALPAEWFTVVPLAEGRAEIGQSTKFTLFVRPTPIPFVPANDYPITVRATSRIRPWSEQETVTIAVERINQSFVDNIWPQIIPPRQAATIAVKNLGNARETFQLVWRSKNGAIAFAPADAYAVVDAQQATEMRFYPSPRSYPWFGREKSHPISAQVIAQSSGKVEIREAQVVVRSVLPPLVLLLSALLLLAALLWVVYERRPVLTNANAGWCLDLPRPSEQPSVVTCWRKETQHVKSVALRLSANEKEMPIIQVRGVISATPTVTPTGTPPATVATTVAGGTLTYTADLTAATHLLYLYEAPDLAGRLDRPQLVVRNQLGEQSWLGPLRWLGTSVYDIPYTYFSPGATPTPVVGQLRSFCVTTDTLQATPVCSDETTTNPTLALVAGQATQLTFAWETENLASSQPVLIPAPQQIDGSARRASAPAPTLAGTYPYTLTMLDASGNILAERGVLVKIEEVGCMVDAQRMDTQIGHAMYKSPGEIYERLGVLPPNTAVIVKSAPAEYTQNLDCRQWVRVVVKNTLEEGWVDFDGLSCSTSEITARFLTEHKDQCVGVAATRVAEMLTPAAEGASGQTDDQPAANAVAPLPVEKPEFGPTATPVLTPTLPPPTPAPTLEPTEIEINLSKEVIDLGECVQVNWRIVGVYKVFFDNGSGEFVASNDNIDRTDEFCKLKRTTTFRWRIVTDQDTDRDDQTPDAEGDSDDYAISRERTVTVQSRPDE